MFFSDSLEDISDKLNSRSLTYESALAKVLNFAETKLNLSLQKENFEEKKKTLETQIEANLNVIVNKVRQVASIEHEIRSLDQQIKVYHIRCKSELKPLHEALSAGNSTLIKEHEKTTSTLVKHN